ncbi:MAG TPA: aminopeptidase P family protein [Pyrinomonadaceae bacterium]|nr:aminopeptidase P family protein [Pyrinomonadaceae bacterium]
MNNKTRRVLFALIAIAAVLIVGSPLSYTTAAVSTAEPPAIRITPPAPVFDDAKRLAELASRRKRVADTIGPKSLLIMFSAEPRVYTNDVDFPFRQENNLYYLTNLNQKRATLVLIPAHNPSEILFLPRRDARAETWTGHMYSPQEAAQLSGIAEIWEASEFAPFIQAVQKHEAYNPKPENVLLSNRPSPPPGLIDETLPSFSPLFRSAEQNQAALYLLVNTQANPQLESREYRQEQRLAANWPKDKGFTIQSAFPIFSQMRVRKSPMELEIMQHAIDISIEAHQRAQAFAAQTKWEYEVDAQVAYTFKLRNADNWGYPDIVGCGPNATTLHYEESQGPVKPGQLMLMDVGAEYGHYSADVTRTFPVSGKFTKEQAEIYQIVYDAQEAAARVIKPGANLSQVHNAATEVIKDGLLKLGLITDRNADWQYRLWFMHGTSHWLGMNVHDVGGGTTFEPGMVFTNEPGIYIRLDALDNLPKTPENEKFIAAIRPAFEKYKGIGVRIEDDMLVTDTGVSWMTGALARSIPDIETFIARARRQAGVR